MSLAIQVRRWPHAAGLALPAYQTAGAAGLDLVAALAETTTMVIEPGAREKVPTGLSIALPDGYEAQVRPRSGLAYRHGVTVLNAPGTIDADFRGEIEVILINHGREPFAIRRGARIAQLVVAPVVQVGWQEVDILDQTERGAGGFGSTGHDPAAGTP